MSKALEAAVKAAHERGYEGTDDEGFLIMPFDERDARAIITAVLDAAAEDEETAHRVADAHIDAFETLDRRAMGKASILALKEVLR